MTQQQVVSASTDPPVRPRCRVRCLLAKLTLRKTMVALLCVLFATYLVLWRARADRQAALDELKKYRSEVGYLEITDPDKLYARPFRQATPRRWAWRIYIPENGGFWIGAATKLVPVEGFPPNAGT